MSESYDVELWKTIRNLWEVVNYRISFSIGNRRRVKFWKDNWCGNEPLGVFFPPYLPYLVRRRLGWQTFSLILMEEVLHSYIL